MIEFLSIAFLTLGGAFLFLGSLGVLRFEDVYLRLQFSTKSLTFGLSFYLLGAAIAAGGADALLKAGLAIAFQFLTAPIAGTMIAKVAMKRGHKPVKMVDGD